MIVDDLFEAPQPCPECGGVSFSNLILAEKKDACYYKVKASAKVWPSAYASGRLVQCRKKGADNYGNKNESEDDNFGKPATLMKASPEALKTAQNIVQKQADKNVIGQAKIAGAVPSQGVAEGSNELYQKAIRKYAQQVANDYLGGGNDYLYGANKFDSEMFGVDPKQAQQDFKTLFAQLTKQQGVAEGEYKSRHIHRQEQNKKYDEYRRNQEAQGKKPLSRGDWAATQRKGQQGVAEEGERGRGRPTTGEWDPTSGKVGRTEKTAQGIRHHADPSRYGGSETEPELDRLDKNKVNAMDKALGVKWDRESKRYYSPIKVDETKPKEKEADYGDDYQAMVARVKKLAGLGPLKTVYDPQKRVYRNVPTAVQPKK